MADDRYLPRALDSVLLAAERVSPVVVLTGARQTGKSTLCRLGGIGAGRTYLTLDDFDLLEQAQRDPTSLLGRGDRIVIDEVQRSPELLLAVKRHVDENREPGRFLLTGSANLLLMERISETLAGRAQYYTLWPFTVGEQNGEARVGRWRGLLEGPVASWPDILGRDNGGATRAWRDIVRTGGYPIPCHHLVESEDRRAWLAGYVQTYLERDLQQLTAVQQLTDFRRLMRACCLRLGNLLNQAELSRDVGLPPTTAQRYLNLLEVSHQLVRLPAYAVNRTKRLTKSPKLYWSDTGLAMHLGGEEEPRGAHLENLILTDLLAWRDCELDRPEILYWRTTKGAEIDFVIEWRGKLLPIEVKASTRAGYRDTSGLRTFLKEYPDLAQGGLLLHDGQECASIAEGIMAAPWWAVL